MPIRLLDVVSAEHPVLPEVEAVITVGRPRTSRRTTPWVGGHWIGPLPQSLDVVSLAVSTLKLGVWCSPGAGHIGQM